MAREKACSYTVVPFDIWTLYQIWAIIAIFTSQTTKL